MHPSLWKVSLSFQVSRVEPIPKNQGAVFQEMMQASEYVISTDNRIRNGLLGAQRNFVSPKSHRHSDLEEQQQKLSLKPSVWLVCLQKTASVCELQSAF